jgi:hypothetical protein
MAWMEWNGSQLLLYITPLALNYPQISLINSQLIEANFHANFSLSLIFITCSLPARTGIDRPACVCMQEIAFVLVAYQLSFNRRSLSLFFDLIAPARYNNNDCDLEFHSFAVYVCLLFIQHNNSKIALKWILKCHLTDRDVMRIFSLAATRNNKTLERHGHYSISLLCRAIIEAQRQQKQQQQVFQLKRGIRAESSGMLSPPFLGCMERANEFLKQIIACGSRFNFLAISSFHSSLSSS